MRCSHGTPFPGCTNTRGGAVGGDGGARSSTHAAPGMASNTPLPQGLARGAHMAALPPSPSRASSLGRRPSPVPFSHSSASGAPTRSRAKLCARPGRELHTHACGLCGRPAPCQPALHRPCACLTPHALRKTRCPRRRRVCVCVCTTPPRRLPAAAAARLRPPCRPRSCPIPSPIPWRGGVLAAAACAHRRAVVHGRWCMADGAWPS